MSSTSSAEELHLTIVNEETQSDVLALLSTSHCLDSLRTLNMSDHPAVERSTCLHGTIGYTLRHLYMHIGFMPEEVQNKLPVVSHYYHAFKRILINGSLQELDWLGLSFCTALTDLHLKVYVPALDKRDRMTLLNAISHLPSMLSRLSINSVRDLHVSFCDIAQSTTLPYDTCFNSSNSLILL